MTSHENNEAGDVRGVSDEQRAEWRDEAEHFAHHYRNNDVIRESFERTLALLDEVDTLRNQLRDMEIERNMLRICVKELTDSLEAGDACGAVGCRAMERLSEVIDEAADDLLVRATSAEQRLARVEALVTRAVDECAAMDEAEGEPVGTLTPYIGIPQLRAALSTERGEGRE